MKTVNRRRAVDSWFWELFVRACGGRCCVCSKNGPLQRGHIHRHADGGSISPENLIPLCKSCNARHQTGFTPDCRPDGWRNDFFKLILVEMGTGIVCTRPKQVVTTISGSEPSDNKEVIKLQNVEFVPEINYTPTSITRPSPTLKPADAERLVWELFAKSREAATPPKPPLAKRQDQMKQTAMRVGEQAFCIAGNEFLLWQPCPWVVGSEERGYAQADSWQHFCDCFPIYLDEGIKRAVQLQAAAESARKSDKDTAERQKADTRVRRWRDYVGTANLSLWPRIPEEDAAFIALVKADNLDEAREITDDCHARAITVMRHHKLYEIDELLAEKDKLYEKIKQCGIWAGGNESQADYVKQLSEFKVLVESARNVESLRKLYQIDYVYADLDPSREQESSLEWLKTEDN